MPIRKAFPADDPSYPAIEEIDHSLDRLKAYFKTRGVLMARNDVIMIVHILNDAYDLKLDIPPVKNFYKYYPQLKESYFQIRNHYFDDKSHLSGDFTPEQLIEKLTAEYHGDMDLMSGWSMFCRDYPLPADFLQTMQTYMDVDRYWLTHVAYQLGNIIYNDCWENKEELTGLKDTVAMKLYRLIESDDEDFQYNIDIKIEAIVMLYYLDRGDLVNPGQIRWLLSKQKEDGGWAHSDNYESNDHTSMLALWALLEYKNYLENRAENK